MQFGGNIARNPRCHVAGGALLAFPSTAENSVAASRVLASRLATVRRLAKVIHSGVAGVTATKNS